MLFGTQLKIKALLGEGLNAQVYRAELFDHDLGIQKTVAFKVLKRKQDLKHFRKELSNFMKVSGSRIVKCYGWKKHRRRPGLIIEYVHGCTLYEIQNSLGLDAREKKWILREVAEGLCELRDSQVFHGDLSPQNIMIDADGAVKLIDFGLANWRTQLIEATPGFVSPKLIEGQAPSYESDLDSLEALSLYLNAENSSPDENEELDFEVIRSCLGVKVCCLLNHGSETVDFSKKDAKSKMQWTLSFSLPALLSLCFLFCTFLPLKMDNAQMPAGFVFQSKEWVAVRVSQKDDWCYTPCKLTFLSGGPKDIYWKKAHSQGVTQVEVKKVGFESIKLNSY